MQDDISIERIIQEAGGAAAIVRAASGEITRDAVYKWRTTGVPDRHWGVLMSLTPFGPTELYAANCKARYARSMPREAAE